MMAMWNTTLFIMSIQIVMVISPSVFLYAGDQDDDNWIQIYLQCQVTMSDVLLLLQDKNGSTCVPAVMNGTQEIVRVCLFDNVLSVIGILQLYDDDLYSVANLNNPPSTQLLRLCINLDHIAGKTDNVELEYVSIWIGSKVSIIGYFSFEFHHCSIRLRDLHANSVVKFLFSDCSFVIKDYVYSPKISFDIIDKLIFINSTFKIINPLLETNPAFSVIYIQTCNTLEFVNFQILHANSSGYKVSSALRLLITETTNVAFINCIFENTLNYQYIQSSKRVEFKGCEMQGKTTELSYIDSIQIDNCKFTNVRISSGDFLTIDGFNQATISNSVFSNIIVSEGNIISCVNRYLGVVYPGGAIYMHTPQHDRYLSYTYDTHMVLRNVLFMNNIGTPIYTKLNTSLNLSDVNFSNNSGTYASAVFIDLVAPYKHVLFKAKFSDLQIKNSKISTEQGGDVYIRNYIENLYFRLVANDVNFEASNPNEDNNGIYIDSVTCSHCLPSYFQGISRNYLRTSARTISKQLLTKNLDIFAGKVIYLSGSIKVNNYFGNDARCNADSRLFEDDMKRNCTLHLLMQGVGHNGKVILETGEEILTHSYVTISMNPNCFKQQTQFTLELTCEDVSTTVHLTLRDCPLGYVVSYHNTEGTEHVCEATDDIVSDDSKEHIACIERDYWYGEMNNTSSGHSRMIKSPCGPPYCLDEREACPINVYAVTHQILPWTQDEQCNGYYGGVLCRSCREQAVFTFGASKCIPLSECKQWQPYLIICLAIVGQIVLTLVMICSRAKTTVGVGYLYGPLFFIAVYKLLPISNKYFRLTSPLEMTFSFYESILLLDLDVLGNVNWCFFNLDEAVHYSMRFIGPLITFLVLLVVVVIAKNSFCYKFRINRIIQSPIQPMCLLIMLSFWSLSRTSIEILKPIVINGEWRFAIQPEYAYLGNGYIIGLFCISVVLLTIFYLPFIFLLLSSQFIRHKINVFRVQPFLDAFQSSYKDNCQWFSGVYLLSWLILNTELPSYAFIIVSFSISAIHFIIHPHKSTFLNVADSLLLVDMLILSSLSYFCSEDHTIMVIKYPLLL